ncbi:Tetratricopeptide repeat-containing protein [Chryseobacterium taichungense]|uniref:Tetratricopeptide repeat-containing protein n=1 Tax=Chryseobacterium taichungense TaxID=295069 RepID=A0A1H8A346_9FLAO|nr:tetratricopeptide repeat protein [Chryseobacterium taichungense]SEM65140.1 Tetratricopeptide repeat-containing protein [Chryseobacterium taichungense]
MDSLKKQNLNNQLLKIDIELSEEENKSIQIFDFILQKFSIDGLDSNEKYFLEYLSLLPSSSIIIEDLILICGKDYVESNKIYFANVINSLEKKGFLQYENGRKSIQIHKILQDSILYSARDERNPFIMSSRYIAWLSGRLSDGYNNPKESFRFLKYAESILNSIKEEYRHSVYQPLLMLENEYLHLSAFFFIRDDNSELWKDLIKRSENYLGKEDIALAAMYNNLALSLKPKKAIEKIIVYLNKAVKIYYKNAGSYKDGDLLMFITILNNLAQAYLVKSDVDSAIKCFNKVSALRKKYYFYSDAQIGVGYTILSELYRTSKNFDKSEALIKEAIRYHNLIPIERRSNFLLSSYYSKLSEYSLLKNNIEDAIIHQQKCVEILEAQEIRNNHIVAMYQFLIDLYKVSNDYESVKKYKDKQNLIDCK